MDTNIQEQVREIKRSFRLVMNGPASASMREKGSEYKVNWGVPLIELKRIAASYGKDKSLAIELWKENIRECKILATLIMPSEDIDPALADLWMEQAPTQEIAEMLAANLFKDVAYAPMIAYQWIATDKPLRQVCGYGILSRLFMRGQNPNEGGINEFIDQALTDIQGNDAGVRHAALNAVVKFSQLGEVYSRIARSALRPLGLDDYVF